jgi:hypothetical protein
MQRLLIILLVAAMALGILAYPLALALPKVIGGLW